MLKKCNGMLKKCNARGMGNDALQESISLNTYTEEIMRKSFVIHIDSLAILDELTDSQCGELLRAMKSHYEEEEINLSSIAKIAFLPFKTQFARDDEKYKKIVERNRNNGLKAWGQSHPVAPSGTQSHPVAPSRTQSHPVAPSGTQSHPVAPSRTQWGPVDADSDSDSDSDSESEKKKTKPLASREVHQRIHNESKIFEYWLQVMNKNQSTKFTKGRMAKIRARLNEGYTVDQIKAAIDGCSKSDYHMGKNDSGKRYDCLTLICRSADKLEQFIGYVTAVSPESKREKEVQDWADVKVPYIEHE
jgi:uncharacterized phage protein (TIGR02220 family)